MIKRRPTETATVTLGVFAAAVAHAAHLSADWTTVVLLGVAGAPAVITWLVARRAAT